VKDASKKVSENAKDLFTNLSQVDMKLLGDEISHNRWMSIKKEIESSAKSISSASAIKEQRSHFKNLSVQLTSAIEIFGINEKVYSQFCPMADNNNGAYWLSKEENVLNPYFGNAMLTCGSVEQIIE